MSSSPKFEQGQKVLARDNDGLLYVAFVRRSLYGQNQTHKLDLLTTIANASPANDDDADDAVVAVSTNNNNKFDEEKWFYFVHYLAWKVNWDRWVDEDALLEITDDHLKWQHRILQEHRQLQRYFKEQQAQRKFDGGAFLKAWKPKLEAVLKELQGETIKNSGKTTTTTITATILTDCRPTKRQKTASSSSSSSLSRQQRRFQQEDEDQKEDERRLQQVLKQEYQLRQRSSLQQSQSHQHNDFLEQALMIPSGLKRILVEEWEILSDPKFGMVLDLDNMKNTNTNTNHNHHHSDDDIMRLPPSIRTILHDYLQSKNITMLWSTEDEGRPGLDVQPPEPSESMKVTNNDALSETGQPSNVSVVGRNEQQEPEKEEGAVAASATVGNLSETQESNHIEPKEFQNGNGKDNMTPVAVAVVSAGATTSSSSTTTTSSVDLDVERERKQNRQRGKEWNDMVHGIIQLFDQALPFRLLYPTEQSQLSVMLLHEQERKREGKRTGSALSLTEFYGANHLVRLMCQLPVLMDDLYFQKKKKKNPKSGKMDPPNDDDDDEVVEEKEELDSFTSQEEMKNLVKSILAKINDLLRFLQKHQNTYFPQRFRKKNIAELEWEQKVITKYQRKQQQHSKVAAVAEVAEVSQPAT